VTGRDLPRTIALPNGVESIALARRAVEQHAAVLSASELDTTRLLVSELVTNAVRYTSGKISLTIDIDPVRARFVVRDDGAGSAERRLDPDADGGFGLNLVATLAARWGAEHHGSVWFELDREAAAASRAGGAPDGGRAAADLTGSPSSQPPPYAEPSAVFDRVAGLTGGSDAMRSVLAPPRWSRWSIATGAAAIVVATADLVISRFAVLAALLVLPPLVSALLGRWADTAAVGALSIVLALIVVFARNANASAEAIAVAIVVLGSALALVVALLRGAAEVSFARLRLLGAVADVGNEATHLGDAVARLLAILTPTFADVALIDTTLGGVHHRLGARAVGPDAVAIESALLRHPASMAEALGGASGTRASSRRLTRIDDSLLLALVDDERDVEVLRGLKLSAAILIPLRARGRTIGALCAFLGTSERMYSTRDFAFLEIFAGRAAVVLDNAGLTSELSTAEQQLSAVLDGLAAAVTVVDGAGEAVYANRAAVELLRFESAEEFVGAPPAETMKRFVVSDETGEPVSLEQLPGRRALAGEAQPAPLLVRNVVRATGEDRWLLNKASTITDATGRIVRVVNVIEDVTQVKRTELAQRLLAEASEALGSSLDYEATLQRIADVTVPRLADWCGLDLPGPDGLVHSVAVAHGDPQQLALAQRLRSSYPVRLSDPEGLAPVIRTGESLVVAELADEMLTAYAHDEEHLAMLRAVGVASLMIVPLRAGHETLGALTLARTDPARAFDDADLALAQELGRRAGTAVLNARLFTERSAIAATLERGLRPPELHAMAGFEVATYYRAAGAFNEVGGDFYDAFQAEHGWMVVIGDVAGHGAEAAALTALARYTLRSAGQLTGDPTRAVRQLNSTLRDLPRLSLCTSICAYLRPDPMATITLANCGHPRPLLLRDTAVQALGEPGPIAGAFDEAEWESTTLELRPGDTVLLLTDGVFDTVGEEGRFGEDRLHETLREAPAGPRELVAHIAAALDAFRQGDPRDDAALVALQYVG
jgi:PAS domain S-box-containing protein